MVGEGVAPFAATTEPDMAIARNRPSGEIAPRRGNVHDVGRTVTSPTSASSAGRFYEVLGKRLSTGSPTAMAAALKQRLFHNSKRRK